MSRASTIAQNRHPFTIMVVAGLATLMVVETAQARPSTRSYTCEGVRDLIYDRGAIVMNTKNASVYRRFVDNRSYCQRGQIIRYHVAPTRSGKCRLKICREDIFRRDD